MLRRSIPLLILSACWIPVLRPQSLPLRWLDLTNAALEVNGLPWYGENNGEMFRLPRRLEDQFRPPVWNLAKSPSGARIRFRTNSNALVIRLEYPSPPNMANMHAFGQTGVDLYVDGVYRGTAIAGKDAAPGKTYEHVYFNLPDQQRVERDVTLYLSLYKPVKVLGVGVDRDAKMARAGRFALAKPILFYGTSITQGGCASRPGLSYQAILGRMLNLDFVNLGFSGNGVGEPEVARVAAEVDAACFVLDFAQNNRTVESLARVYGPFIETIRAKHPETPILAITPIYSTSELNGHSANEAMRALIRETVSRRIAEGDRNIQVLEGTDLLGPAQGDGLVDGTHPNDLGFQWMAGGLASRLRKLLALPPASY